MCVTGGLSLAEVVVGSGLAGTVRGAVLRKLPVASRVHMVIQDWPP